MVEYTAEELKRFWSRVAIGNEYECWEWQRYRDDKAGYGWFWFNKSMQPTHRVSYQLVIGEIPDGMKVCHSCDNPPCCNPTHLWLGTQRDNVRDMHSKGRGGNFKGENNSKAKLSEADVLEIRRLLFNGVKQKDIAARYGVYQQLISMISLRQIWNHID